MDLSLGEKRCVLIGVDRQLAERCRADGARVWAVRAGDGADWADGLVKTALGELGGIDVLIIRVGLAPTPDTAESWRSAGEPTVRSAAAAVTTFATQFAARRHGSIVVVIDGKADSLAGTMVTGAILGLIRHIAATHARFGVRINAVIADGVDAAEPVVFLASDAAALVTGGVLPAGGATPG
jgi:NAD(P)-dependent dehydrogenase (short-subunit alcohol dehydrogenase family)